MRPDFKNKLNRKRNIAMGASNDFAGLSINLPSEIVVKRIPAYEVKA